jgi:hypothetical protein
MLVAGLLSYLFIFFFFDALRFDALRFAAFFAGSFLLRTGRPLPTISIPGCVN